MWLISTALAGALAGLSPAELGDVAGGGVVSSRDAEGGFRAWFLVPAPTVAVYSVLADHASMSLWLPRLERSEVLIPSAPCADVAFRVPTPIGDVEYRLSRCADGRRVWWNLLDGPQFEALRGAYELEAHASGTVVQYWSVVVGKVPVPEWAQAEAGRIGVTGLVDGLRAEVARREQAASPGLK